MSSEEESSDFYERGICRMVEYDLICFPASTVCRSKAFSKDYRDTVLGMHNNFRSLVATGRAKNGFYQWGNAPQAALMYLMIYNCSAEAYAYAHVRRCSGRPSHQWERPGMKESIHVLRTTATDTLGAIQNAIATWQAELANYGVPSNMRFTFWMPFWPATRVTK
ncbi:hypothetical protein OSTOST_13637, partial [Ostertagia ostertagi]